MARKFLAFDLETATDVPGDDFNWRPHRPLGISCAATLSTESSTPKLWYGGQERGTPTARMERNEAAELVQYLIEMAAAGFTIVTWNGLAFDYDILSEESGLLAECKQLALEQVDMMFQVFCIKGFPVGLDNVARGSGVPGKVAGMSGVKAPPLWQQGRYQEVLDYVAQDVRTTLQVACVCDQRRSLTWVTRKGSLSQCSLPSSWLAVREALRLPEPDTSWMDTPMSRSSYTAWLSDISESQTSRSTRLDGPGAKDIDATLDSTRPAHPSGIASSGGITEIGLMTDTSANGESNRRVSLTKIQRATEIGAELLSLCQTVTADGALSDEEVQSLRDWLRSNSNSDLPAISFLIPVVEKIVADGIITSNERRELFIAVEKVLPQDVREMSRTARRAREQAGKEQQKLWAEEAKRKKQEERERNSPIEHFDFMVAGAKHEGRPALIARYARVPDPVFLNRDTANRHSRNAVTIVTAGGHHIGFVPEEDAIELAPLLDSDHPYTARIKKILSGSSHGIPVIIADIYRKDSTVPNVVPASAPVPAISTAPPRGPKSNSATKVVIGIIAVALIVVAVRSCG